MESINNRIRVIEGDITRQAFDAIVNAANATLLGGGGVDGAIHRAAGPSLLEECRKLGGCPTGSAKLTKGYNLPAKWIIHTVGPVWRGGISDEDELLANCYKSCLTIAVAKGIRTIGFPCISTGAYGFPADRAAEIAAGEVVNHLRLSSSIQAVILVCFGRDAYELSRGAVDRSLSQGDDWH